jgi:hypothetical protein
MPYYELLSSELTWRLGVGDPTLAGWVTVAGYAITLALSCRVARSPRPAGTPLQTSHILFWWITSALLLLLGLNKQLDLQTLLTDIFRIIARADGWYEDRRDIQRLFIGIISSASVVFMLGFTFLIRQTVRRDGPALLGISFLVFFVLLRASSFHHLDPFISLNTCGFQYYKLLELIGLAGIALTAYCQLVWASRGSAKDPS